MLHAPVADLQYHAKVVTASQQRIDSLENCLSSIRKCTQISHASAESIKKSARVLNNLTSPATDHSAKLAAAARNIQEVQNQISHATEMMERVDDCAPAIEALFSGAKEIQKQVQKRRQLGKLAANKQLLVNNEDGSIGSKNNNNQGVEDDLESSGGPLTMPVVGASPVTSDMIDEAKNVMEELKEAWDFYERHPELCNSSTRKDAILNLYARGLRGMSILINAKLSEAGKGIRLKKNSTQSDAYDGSNPAQETYDQTRHRLTSALNNRKLLKSVGEYEDYLPFDKQALQEIRTIFECLADKQGNSQLITMVGKSFPEKELKKEDGKDERYSKFLNTDLKTGFMHVDVYGKSRKLQAYNALDSFYKKLSGERKEEVMVNRDVDLSDLEARDVVRCIEHAMVVIIAEQGIHKTAIVPYGVRGFEDGDLSQKYRDALSSAYSHIVACVVERIIRILEHTFYKQAKASAGSVATAGSSTAAGLRILDGVRILGPTLAKVCDVTDAKKGFTKTEASKGVSSLCVELHRLTVKGCAKAMDNFVSSLASDSLKNVRSTNIDVSSTTFDVIDAIRSISGYQSAYKSVTKRRALPWDPKIGEECKDMDAYMKHIISKLCKNIEEKANIIRKEGQGKSHLFVVVNAHCIIQSLKPKKAVRRGSRSHDDSEQYKITQPWFKQKVGNLMELEKDAYLELWESLVSDMTVLESRLSEKELYKQIKAKFSTFNDHFEKLYYSQSNLRIEDESLRRNVRVSIREKFFNQYVTFFDKYSQIPFSKKKIDEYLKYKPATVENMVNVLFADKKGM